MEYHHRHQSCSIVFHGAFYAVVLFFVFATFGSDSLDEWDELISSPELSGLSGSLSMTKTLMFVVLFSRRSPSRSLSRLP